MKHIIWLVLLGCSFGFAQEPAWYVTHTHRDYRPARFILGVGTADGSNAVEKAKKNAQVEIVSQIRVQVKGEMKRVSESFQLEGHESLADDFSSRSRSVVNEDIDGIAIVETAYDSVAQRAYALAVLDRERYARSVSEEMAASWRNAAALHNAADAAFRRGRLEEALQSCDKARTMLLAVLPKKALHDAVAGNSYLPPDSLTPVSLTVAMQAMVSAVRIEKLEGGDQAGTIGHRFSRPMTVRVMIDTIPASGIPLVFESTDSQTLREMRTDARGEASYRGIIRLLPDGLVRIRLELGSMAREFRSEVLAGSVHCTVDARPSDVGFELAPLGMTEESAATIKGTFAASLGAIGYRVLPSSRYLLQIALRSKPGAVTEGVNGRLYTVQIEAVATLIDKHTKATLGHMSCTASGGGRSEGEAAAKASAHLTVNRMKLAELIEMRPQEPGESK